MSRPPLSDVAREIEDEGAWDQFLIELGLGLISPFMMPVTLANAYHDWYHYGPVYQGDDPPPRRFDAERARLHAVTWGTAAVGSWAYHAWVHPGKYPGLRTSGDVVKMTGHWAIHSPMVHRVVGVSARTAPPVVVAAAGVTAAVAIHDVAEGAATAGQQKPSWIPLPMWALLWS